MLPHGTLRPALSALGLALGLSCGGSTSGTVRAPDDGSTAGGGDAGTVAGDDGGFDVEATVPARAADATSEADAANASAIDAMGCGPSRCAGCCSGGQCVSGTTQTACGHQGSPCADCTSLGATCTADDGGAGGACQLPATCGPNTCPMGCCDPSGVCQRGIMRTACGGGGASCQTCLPAQACNQQQCVPACTPQTCPSGCCDSAGICEPGTDDTQCGTGQACLDCTVRRGVCSSQRCTQGGRCPGPGCVTPPDGGLCNGQTCPSGCCDAAGNCQQGITGTACGTLGASCENCIFNDQLCSNQQCVDPPGDGGPSCSNDTCLSGCCDALGGCVVTLTDSACGGYGSSCIDCRQAGARCNVASGQCDLPNGTEICEQSCSGCCDANGTCHAGLTDTQCGENGIRCVSCTTLNPPSTCDVHEATCTSQGTLCPAAYPTCPAALEASAPAPNSACSTDEIDNAAAACAGGPSTTACSAFFAFEASSNAPCGACLQTFLFDFATETGIRSCVAPYVDATCNHNSACLVDCVTDACFDCDPSTACQTLVRSGTCATYVQADGCVLQALAGPAAVCNPATYQENFGAWLLAVGAAYCARP